MKRIRIIFAAVLAFVSVFVASPYAHAALTASEVVSKGASAISAASGLKCTFSISSSGQSMSGSLIAKGDNFMLRTPMATSWFDGHTLWTYNPRIQETTVSVPTEHEIREANPLRYLKSHKRNYSAIFARTQPKGKYAVVLVPKVRNTGIKRIDITLGGASCLPEIIKVTPDSGSPSVVTVKGIQTNVPVAVSEFRYPASDYPQAEIIDLR